MSDEEASEGFPTVIEHVAQSPGCPGEIEVYEIIPDEEDVTKLGVVAKCPKCGALVLTA